jgi:hypothetical protein
LPFCGSIEVYRGDARHLDELDLPVSAGAVICSPPYGNRLRDIGAQFGSKDERSWKDICSSPEYNKQYSLDPDNIGNSKIQVICSPPYAHGEHSKKKIQSIRKHEERELGHGMKAHDYIHPDNIAKLNRDSGYSREMLKVYKSLYDFLAPDAVVALVTRNFIQNKKVVLLDELTIKLMKNAGFTYLETKRASNPEFSFFRTMNYKKRFKKLGLPRLDWEEITFYQR